MLGTPDSTNLKLARRHETPLLQLQQHIKVEHNALGTRGQSVAALPYCHAYGAGAEAAIARTALARLVQAVRADIGEVFAARNNGQKLASVTIMAPLVLRLYNIEPTSVR